MWASNKIMLLVALWEIQDPVFFKLTVSTSQPLLLRFDHLRPSFLYTVISHADSLADDSMATQFPVCLMGTLKARVYCDSIYVSL